MGLTRVFNLGIKAQTTPGAAETLAAADYAGHFEPPQVRHTPGENDRNISRGGTLSSLGMMKGTRLLTLSGVTECVGGGAAAEAPFHRWLHACGMRKHGLKKIEITSVTNGPFRPGDVVGNHASQASASKTGLVMEQYQTADAVVLYYLPLTGVLASGGDSVYAYRASGAQPSAVVDVSPADGGHLFRFQSKTASAEPQIFTARCIADGEFHTLTDALGTGRLTFEVGAAPKLAFDLTGCPVLADTLDLATGSAPANIPAVAGTPISVLHGPLRIGLLGGLVTGRLELDLGNTVSPRPTITDAEYVQSGHRGVLITQRGPKVTVEPEYVPDANGLAAIRRTYAYEEFPVSGAWGDPAVTGRLGFFATRGQLQGDLGYGDANGIRTAPLSIALLGDADDELHIYHVF